MCPSANGSGVLHWQVAQHNTPHDCWVSFNGGVYDLTPLIKVSPLLGLQQLRQQGSSNNAIHQGHIALQFTLAIMYW